MNVERLFLFGLLLILTQSHYGHFKLFLDQVFFNPIDHQWYFVLKIVLNLIQYYEVLPVPSVLNFQTGIIYLNSERSEQFLKPNTFLTCCMLH